MSPRDIRVRGGATVEELAAVLAVMTPRPEAVERYRDRFEALWAAAVPVGEA